ncbi:MAG: SlyX family protein [Thalassolituus sp.]
MAQRQERRLSLVHVVTLDSSSNEEEILMSEERFLDVETKLAYQEDLVESLNKVVSDQQRQIDTLEKTCRKMANRLMDLSEAFEATQVEDAPPPHY